tara:strand:+ start:107460 stop:107705 length:246 start_codon:yes stop_codon:yes gene_type:complete
MGECLMSNIRYRVLGFENAENYSMKPDRDTLVLSEVFSDVGEAYDLFYARKDVYHREVEVGEVVDGKFVVEKTEAVTMHVG